MTTASWLYQKDALDSLDSHLVYSFSSWWKKFTYIISSETCLTCLQNTATWRISTPSSGRLSTILTARKFTYYLTLKPITHPFLQQTQRTTDHLLFCSTLMYWKVRQFSSLDPSFLENTNSGLPMTLTSYMYSPHSYLLSSLQFVLPSLKMLCPTVDKVV